MKIVEAVFALLKVVIARLLGLLWTGYVASVLWGWFVVPTFSVAYINTLQGTGLILVTTLATAKYRPMADNEKKGERWVFTFLTPLFFLAFGWVIKSWM